MTSKNKKRILVGSIVLLVLINLSAIVTMGYNKYQRNKIAKEESNSHKKIHDKSHHERVKHFVKRELELDQKQFDKFCKLKEENSQKMDSLVEKMRVLKKSIITEIIKEEPEQKKLMILSDSIGYQHKLMQMEMNMHLFKLKGILKPEQSQNFERMLHKMDQKSWSRKRRRFWHDEKRPFQQKERHRGRQHECRNN